MIKRVPLKVCSPTGRKDSGKVQASCRHLRISGHRAPSSLPGRRADGRSLPALRIYVAWDDQFVDQNFNLRRIAGLRDEVAEKAERDRVARVRACLTKLPPTG